MRSRLRKKRVSCTYHDGPFGGLVVHLLQLADDASDGVDRGALVQGIKLELEVLHGLGKPGGVETGVTREGAIQVRRRLGVGIPSVPQRAVRADVSLALAPGGLAHGGLLGAGLLDKRLLDGRLLDGRLLAEDGGDVEGGDSGHSCGFVVCENDGVLPSRELSFGGKNQFR